MQYIIIIETAADGHLWGYFPDVPGCTTSGRTVEEVRSSAIAALEEHLEGEEPPPAHSLRELLEEGLELAETDVTAAVRYELRYATA